MKVLVTGGTGFTGAYLVRSLVDRGADVRVLARKPDSSFLSGFDVEVSRGSVEEPEAVERAMRGVECVYHLAAAYRTGGIENQAYYRIHVKGTENVMEAALRQGVSRVVHCSTVGVHGHIDDPPADETYRFAPGDVYQETKLLGEQVAWRYYRERGLPVSVIRPTPIYGPGDMRLLKLFKIACRNHPVILGDGQIFYHMVYVNDLVQGFLLAAEKKEAVGESFIVGGKECTSLKDLIGLIREVMGLHQTGIVKLPAAPLQWIGSICERLCIPLGIEPPIYRRRVDFFTKSRSFDIAKAKRLLGYEPKMDLRAGLKQTGMAYRESGLL